MRFKNLPLLWITALILGWIFDQLFWQKTPGISFPIYVTLLLAAGGWLTWHQGLRSPWSSLALVLPTLFFAWMSFVRMEPGSLLAAYGLTLGGVLLLGMTWAGGRWWQYAIVDYVLNGMLWLAGVLTIPLSYLGRRAGSGASPNNEKAAAELPPAGDELLSPSPSIGREGKEPALSGGAQSAPLSKGEGAWRTLRSILRGLLLAAPVLIVFVSLLTAADAIFAQELRNFFDLFSLDKLGEYFFRSLYVLILAYLLAGGLLYALFYSQKEKVSNLEKPWLKPFLGWLEACIVLGSVNLLFALFVVVQFKYFFGGRANITLEGFTYAEYARRGFGELVVVALLSLLLFLALSLVTRRESRLPRSVFSGLGLVLVGLLGVMLVAAFQRLLLYETAYGFSRMRTYPHIFMLWLGVLLLATALLEVSGRLRYFALAALLTAIGFGATLNLLNVDALIVNRNVERAVQGYELDRYYLADLSPDAVPALFEHYHDETLPPALHAELGGVLACQAAQIGEMGKRYSQDASEPPVPAAWPSFHLSRWQAQTLLRQYVGELETYQPEQGEYGLWTVMVDGEVVDCQQDWYMD